MEKEILKKKKSKIKYPKRRKFRKELILLLIFQQRIRAALPPAQSPCFFVKEHSAITFTGVLNDPATRSYLIECPAGGQKMRISSWFKLNPGTLLAGESMILFRYSNPYIYTLGLQNIAGNFYFYAYNFQDGATFHKIRIHHPYHWSFVFHEMSATNSELALRTSYNFQNDELQNFSKDISSSNYFLKVFSRFHNSL